MSHQYIIQAGGTLEGSITVAGDKSISHRALMLTAIAHGNSQISGLLHSDDVLCTLAAMRAIGVPIEENTDGTLIVHGNMKFHQPREPIYVGNSGTAMRLLSGLLAGLNIPAELQGDDSLSKRPMRRVVDPLCSMGFIVKATTEGTAPIVIEERDPKMKIEDFNYTLPVASAQIKSCLLMAALFSPSRTIINEPSKSRNHTELMLRDFGADIRIRGDKTTLVGGHDLCARDIQIPSDLSSASFFIVAATLIPNSDIILKNVGLNPTRDGVIQLLKQMGADIHIHNKRQNSSEIIADLHVRYAPLRGISIGEEYVALAIDEFPILFIAASCAKGKTRLRGASELREKESDRIQVMAQSLEKMNIKVKEYDDGIDITGGRLKAPNERLESHNDHRIAMALSVAAMAMQSGHLMINNVDTVESSFPDFHLLMQSAGMRIQRVRSND